MNRADLIAAIEERLAGRRLVWFGTRGSDAAPLKEIDGFAGVYSIIAPLGVAAWSSEQEICLEQLSGERLDLNAYHIDNDRSPIAATLHRRMLNALGGGTVVAAYRSCHFVSAACHALGDESELLGMFHGIQTAFDYKPWVESALRDAGVRTIPWTYFSDHDWHMINERPLERPHVLRASYSDGGMGLVRLGSGAQLDSAPDWTSDRLMAMAPELTPNVPLNAAGCIYEDGSVTVHAPSVQLIGLDSCTSMAFGYCGNDFGVVADVLTVEQLNELEVMIVATGKWMWKHGYRGAFGIDALLYEDTLCLAEINPRFQGSSATSAKIAAEIGVCDIYLDHLGALLGVHTVGERPSLAEQAQMLADAHTSAQVVAYSRDAARIRSAAPTPDLDWAQLTGVPLAEGTLVNENAMLFKLILTRSVTSTGFEIDKRTVRGIEELRSSLFREAPANETDRIAALR